MRLSVQNIEKDQNFLELSYWNERLREYPSLEGVGLVGVGRRFNSWLYRAKLRTLKRLQRKRSLSFRGLEILDVGCGLGFWIDFYLKEGARAVYGIDVSSTAVRLCRKTYSIFNNVKVLNIDFRSHIPSNWVERFDVANCFDVAYHIVDDNEFGTFMNNTCIALKPGGYLLINDIFRSRHEVPHVRFRELNQYEIYLRSNDIMVLDLIPMYSILSPITSTEGKRINLIRNIANVIAQMSKTSLGSLVCPLAYAIDSILTLTNAKLSSLLLVGLKRT